MTNPTDELAESDGLPPLPEAEYLGWAEDMGESIYAYTATQLREYARACLAGQAAAPEGAAPARAPAAAYEGPQRWTPEEVAQDNKGIRWVTETFVAGRPTQHDVLEYLEARGEAVVCGCDECKRLLAALASAPTGAQAIEQSAAPAAVVPKDHEIREMVDRVTAIARGFHATEQLRERIAFEVLPFVQSVERIDADKLQWTDERGVEHSMPVSAAVALLREFWDRWPGGLDEIEASVSSWRSEAIKRGFVFPADARHAASEMVSAALGVGGASRKTVVGKE